MDKVKILCLHGYRQNDLKFKAQTGSFRKLLKDEAEFHYLCAPHQIPESEVTDKEDQRAWWFTKPNSFSSRDVTDLDKGLTESIKVVENSFEKHGPFQGILGFSQGAALAGLLCALKERKEINLDFQFVIIFSGFKSLCVLHSKYYEQKININSLHVIGETDQIISRDMSYTLANSFTNPVVLTHPGGHFVPGQSVMKSKYLDFIRSQKVT